MDPTIKEQKTIHEFQEVVENIMALLRRDTMKVVFVGHTSNGKSTVINGMLWQAVMPVGIGHTTSCFCSVQGTDEEAYMMVGENGPRQCVTHVKQVAHALQARKGADGAGMGEKNELRELVRVFWQKSMCRLLSDGVVFIDTPGLDMDERYDEWIDRFCYDADVFVLVVNAEATLKHTEKTFFTEVAKKLSKPNVFVLYNRWDISDDDDDAQAVLEQHFDKGAAFLTQELGLPVQPNERIFFVSAKETLLHRTKQGRSNILESNPNAQLRYEEFMRFEQNFEACISESAIRTKFESHIVRGMDILTVLLDWLQRLSGDIKQMQRHTVARLDECCASLRRLEVNGSKVCESCEDTAQQMERIVSDAVTAAFKQLLDSQLYPITMQFDSCVFRPETMSKYKVRLVDFIGSRSCDLLRESCEPCVTQAYNDAQEAMVAKVQSILGAPPAYTIHTCTRPLVTPAQLTEGALLNFEEDIDFHFSLSWSALTGNEGRGGAALAAVNSGYRKKQSVIGWLVQPGSLIAASSVAAVSLTRPRWWQTLLAVGGLWGGLYAWEYMTYTNAAKERRFKVQLMSHMANHFQNVSRQLSAAAGQMYGESVRDRQLKMLLCQLDEAKGVLRREKSTLEKDIGDRGKVIQHAELTMGQARHVHSEMESFYKCTICAVGEPMASEP